MSPVDTAGRTRVTRMTSDGTVKNVWGDEPTAEVDLDLGPDFDFGPEGASVRVRDTDPNAMTLPDGPWPESVLQDNGTYRTW